jgi:hypothetical protein
MARRRCDTQRWWLGALWQELFPFAPGARTGMTLRPGLMLRGPHTWQGAPVEAGLSWAEG